MVQSWRIVAPIHWRATELLFPCSSRIDWLYAVVYFTQLNALNRTSISLLRQGVVTLTSPLLNDVFRFIQGVTSMFPVRRTENGMNLCPISTVDVCMDTFDLIIRLCATVFVGYQVYSGTTWGNFRYSNNSWHTIPQRVYRDESPGFFWINIVLQVACILFLWFR